MFAIVFDLELVKRFRKGQLSEIVEIGACKVDFRKKRIVDQFQIYITPRSGYVSKSTRSFINMKKEDMKNAVSFQTGIERFIDWLGKDYYLCSWGRDDRLHFINECLRNKMNIEWFKNYNDLQRQVGKIMDPTLKNQLGLKTALQLAGIEPIGVAHRGIDDAINTAELLLKYAEDVTLQMNTLPLKEVINHYKKRNKVRSREQEQAKVMKIADNPKLANKQENSSL